MGKYQGHQHRDDSADADGQAAHGAFGFSQLQGLGGADGMAAGSDGKAGGYRIFCMKHTDQERCQDASQDSGEDNSDDRNRNDTSPGPAYLCGNGGSHGFGQQGGGHGRVQPE